MYVVKPSRYNGHRSKSFRHFHSRIGPTAWRLCMSPLLGSSLSSLLTRINSSRSVKYPLPRPRPRVCVIEGGMRIQEAIPISRVKRPSRRKSLPRASAAVQRWRDRSYHCHPDHPAIPLICRMPAATNDPKMLHTLRTVQNHESRMGNSLDLYQYVI